MEIVSMMSTKYTGELVDTGKTHFQTKQNILKPEVIHEYSVTIGVVDNLSRVIDPYDMQRKEAKWWQKLAVSRYAIRLFCGKTSTIQILTNFSSNKI